MKCRTKFCLSFHKVIVMEIAIKSKFVVRKQTPFRTCFTRDGNTH